MSGVPRVKVGIMNEPEVDFVLFGEYRLADGTIVTGEQHAEVTAEGQVAWNGTVADVVTFEPSENGFFELKGVTIGVNFHWERKEDQRFSGALHLIVENGKLTAVNVLPVEDYLLSVISSEMSATASLELLKAHAVISRSWLLAQIDKNKRITEEHEDYKACEEGGEDEMIKWYDREDHVNFDVCADDHCQRYQGITKETSPNVAVAIGATRGEVLMSEGDICDARFSKSCGGVSEEYQYCWENIKMPYLLAVRDTA